MTDPKVFREIFAAGRTKGVFQFESGGMQDLLMKLKPDRIEDLIAANALYRPGPMALIPDYIDRKHGAQVGRAAPDHAGGAGRDLRDHGLSGTGDADLQPAGRYPAARGVYADQGDRQKETGCDRQAEKKRFVEGCVAKGLTAASGRGDI